MSRSGCVGSPGPDAAALLSRVLDGAVRLLRRSGTEEVKQLEHSLVHVLSRDVLVKGFLSGVDRAVDLCIGVFPSRYKSMRNSGAPVPSCYLILV